MAVVEFHLPDIGEGLAEVELVRWYVKVGDAISENQPIADVESDKSVVTMPAPASGVVSRLCVTEGERVKVGALMMVVDGHTSAVGGDGAHHAGGAALPPADEGQDDRGHHLSGAEIAADIGTEIDDRAIAAAPAARRLAQERQVDLRRVTGTGPRGRITVEDVERATARPASPAAAADAEAVESVPFRGVRRRIAEAMSQSYSSIPHVSGFHEIDAEALVRLYTEAKPRAERVGVRLTYLPFIVKATVAALQAQPYLNATLDEANAAILLKKTYHIGIATSAPDGLMVPVVKHADRLGLLDLAREIERLATGARNRSLAPADLQQGTFTITNTGAQRGWINTSLIRSPEVAILGAGRIEDRAVVRSGQVVARPVLPLVLTFDHRVVDGEQGLGFMLALREQLEHPDHLLDESLR